MSKIEPAAHSDGVFPAIATFDQRLMLWMDAQKEVAAAVEKERRMREAIWGSAFPNPKEGSQSLELGGGYKLKGDWGWAYNLENKKGETVAVINEIIALPDPEAAFIAKRLVKWKPDLSVSEWRAICEGKPQIKEIIGKVLTIKPGLPRMEIVPPSTKR